MIFRDLIPPDKFKVGMKCKASHSGVICDEFVTISKINHEHKYYAILADDDSSWSGYGTYISQHYINTSCDKFRYELMKALLCNNLLRIIPI
jgi:hypothetical protein